ncbi:hypothetical protein L3N51_02204 [Metallosphaera sp. J1]|uniref:AAA family ATPase n=1 Tax=Metallosphaera javensis (ex Hofmann et al. 2022) TaxID=99938 RepID=UPI001EDE5DDC|nr:ATP-binding protein [Metallosphaera javensis (ex Hofmann et al. 2022)]MCG3109907.1 hypothetical protein [Metallosphaera javensis (ex Hofmann et al. 2022)]
MIFVDMIFVDREKELESLSERLESPNFELVIIYGRRRIGKTSLILRAISNREDTIYYYATEKNNLQKFKELAQRKFQEIKYVKEDWESIFHFLRDKVIVIDEFPYLISEDKSILSTFQKIVDEMRESKTKIILLGSSISVMEDVLSYKSPLYGRRTASLKIGELRFRDLHRFGFSGEEAVRVYGFAGGVPMYLSRVRSPFLEWINQELRRVDSFLRDEMDFMLRYEFRDIATYKEILRAISMGRNTLNEIRDYVRVGGDISSYLKKLERIDLIAREIPVTESVRSKRGRYVIRDNFTNFWFRFIYPNLSLIEQGIYELTGEEYNGYLGLIFERVCREYTRDRFGVRKVGRQWWKDVEIDVLGLGKVRIAGECKWSENVDPYRIVTSLEDKIARLGLTVDKYAVFARSFTKKEKMDNVELVDIDDLNRWLSSV